jgi:hypothetical protein
MGWLPSSIVPREAHFAHVDFAFRLAEIYVPFVRHADAAFQTEWSPGQQPRQPHIGIPTNCGRPGPLRAVPWCNWVSQGQAGLHCWPGLLARARGRAALREKVRTPGPAGTAWTEAPSHGHTSRNGLPVEAERRNASRPGCPGRTVVAPPADRETKSRTARSLGIGGRPRTSRRQAGGRDDSQKPSGTGLAARLVPVLKTGATTRCASTSKGECSSL